MPRSSCFAIGVLLTFFQLRLFASNLITFNDNGAWCWYQDPRIVHDPTNNTLLISSVAASEGPDGATRAGDIDLVTYDLKTGNKSGFILHHSLQPQDDHNAAAILIRPDGSYLAMYSRHNVDNFTYWRISAKPHDASAWNDEQIFDWTPLFAKVDPKNHATYCNLFYLSSENRTYNFSRAINTDPSILISDNQGDTWSYAGKLLTKKRLGYVNGYTKYASNGRDRIDFFTTDHHPRDFNNNVYHGYIQAGKLHRTDGSVVDENILDDDGHPQDELSKVFAASTPFGQSIMTHAWTVCVKPDPSGRPFGLITARANQSADDKTFSDHRLFHARLNKNNWEVNEVAKLGPALWPAEQDYTGLADIDSLDANVIYISTPIDPRDGKTLKHHEIFKGITTDDAKSWTWTAITTDSPVDNLRPIVSSWEGNRAILWFRGTMTRSQHYNCAVVGIIEHK
jgi:hypothetical protein